MLITLLFALTQDMQQHTGYISGLCGRRQTSQMQTLLRQGCSSGQTALARQARHYHDLDSVTLS